MNCPQLKLKYEELLTKQNEFQGVLATFQGMKSNTPDERDVLAGELKRLQGEIGKIVDENFDFIWKDKIIKKQKEALETFFQKIVDVPPIPDGVSLKQIADWEKMGMELCYLPEEDMTEDRDVSGWTERPTNLFLFIQYGEVSPEATKIKAGWRLIDKIPKPKYNNGNQMYKDDPLKDVITELRKNGIIEQWDGKDQGSRFNISNDELQKPEVKTAFANALGVDPKNIRLFDTIEWNVIGCIYHKEWGKTDVSEWFNDECKNSRRLQGGIFGNGGFSSIGDDTSNHRGDYCGFRLLVVLS